MTAHQIDDRDRQLEERVSILENELAQLKQLLSEDLPRNKPWWEKIAGSFEGDRAYDEAMRLGREYRQSTGDR